MINAMQLFEPLPSVERLTFLRQLIGMDDR